MRTRAEVSSVLALSQGDLTTSEIARRCGIPRSTVRDWRQGRIPSSALDGSRASCEAHKPEALDQAAYAYLLGMYLGDGCISTHPRVYRLRVILDSAYPGIVAECAAAMNAITPGRVSVAPRPGERSVEVSNYWRHWPCLFPQHGPGKKHLRAIALRSWQDEIVSSFGEQFIRGLIHSDGTRIVATERKGSYVRRAPRYAFSNLSEDILGLFTDACDRAGVRWTRSSKKQVSVYSKDAVARLDQFVGPKQ